MWSDGRARASVYAVTQETFTNTLTHTQIWIDLHNTHTHTYHTHA